MFVAIVCLFVFGIQNPQCNQPNNWFDVIAYYIHASTSNHVISIFSLNWFR
eukprot:gnl/Chilomastix_caulleri/2084.p2 GENE.gnl/Chilomastix_caulleri/2084~~gnl/Chilomastix_caulleri/2084.p2  ORF type:complete len:51 (-),score=10.14 gnl/Chilomastix_caulleri/2084:262-414(-)